MMKARMLFILVVAIAGCTALAADSQASSAGWTTERYYTQETSHFFADIGKKDNGGPDDIYVTQQALTSLDGTRVGEVNGYGVNLHPPYVFFHYTGTDRKGSITLEGVVNVKQPTQVYVISGGTGAYTGARGTVTTTDAGKKGRLVVIRYHT